MIRTSRAGLALSPGQRFRSVLGLFMLLGGSSCGDNSPVSEPLREVQVTRNVDHARQALASNDALIGFERVERLEPPFLIVYVSKASPDAQAEDRLDEYLRLLRAWHAYFAKRWAAPLGLAESGLIPVALFRTNEEFTTFTRARGLRLGSDVGGLVDATLDWALVRDDVRSEESIENTASMIVHEVTHLAHSRARKSLGGTAEYAKPIWLAEGWAQYDAVVDSSGGGFAFAKDSSRRREMLAGDGGAPPMPLPPLRLLVGCARSADWERMYRDWIRDANPGFNEWLAKQQIQAMFPRWATDVLYLQSWALFRFLAEGTSTRTKLEEFMKATLRAAPETDRWDIIFGREFELRTDQDWSDLQKAFDRFTRRGG